MSRLARVVKPVSAASALVVSCIIALVGILLVSPLYAAVTSGSTTASLDVTSAITLVVLLAFGLCVLLIGLSVFFTQVSRALNGETRGRSLGATLRGVLALVALYGAGVLVVSVLYGLLAIAVDGLFGSLLPLTTIKTIVTVATTILTLIVLPFALAVLFTFGLGDINVRTALRQLVHIRLRLYAKLLLAVTVTWLIGWAASLLTALIPLPTMADAALIVLATVLGVVYLFAVLRLFIRDTATSAADVTAETATTTTTAATSAAVAAATARATHRWSTRKMPTKFLSVLLTVCLVATMVPLQAAFALTPHAAEPEPNTSFARNEQPNNAPAAQESPDEVLLREPVLNELEGPEVIGGTEAYHDKTSKTFEMQDGTYLTRIYPQPLTYTNENGQEEDIDNTLVAQDDSFTNKANSYEVTLPKDGQAIEIQSDGHTLALTPLFGVLANAVVKENAIRYNNIMNGVDLQYTAAGAAVKEDIIINYPLDDPQFSFTLEAAGISFINSDNTVYGYAEGDLDNEVPLPDTTPVFTLTAPVMTDNAGESSQDIRLSLSEDAGSYTLTVMPNADWLAAPERAYPVFIDPTYELSSSDITCGTIQALGNTLSAGPNIPHLNSYLYVGLETGTLVGTTDPMTGMPIAYGQSRAFVRINDITPYIANLPQDVILSAHFNAYRYSGNSSYRTVSAKMIASDWRGAAYTWNNQPYSLTDLANAQDVSYNSWVSWDITDAFKSWQRDPSTNRGIMLTPEDESQAAVCFSGPSNPHGGRELYFEISWTVPNAVDENKPFDTPNVKLRPYTTKDGATGLQKVTGLTADGEVRPQLEVDYLLATTSATVDSGIYPSAEWGRVFPDSTSFEGVIDFTLGYYDLYESNWQSKLFTTFTQNTIYNVLAQATDGTDVTPLGKSDDFIIYEFKQADTLPSVATYYGVTREQLVRDNRVQDNLAFAGNTLFIRNPTQNATVPYTRPDNLTLEQKRALIYASMGRNMVSEFDIEPVDMATGNFYFESTDASNSDYTTTFDLTRSYNALAPKTPGAFGLGWSFSYLQTLTGRADGGMSYSRGDGKILVFEKDSGGGFMSPTGYNLTLEEHGAADPADVTYTITDANATVWAFDCYGILTSLTDRQQNTTKIGYDAAYRLASLTTPSGKVYAITTNAAGQITKVIMPNGGELAYTYEDDCLTSFTNADGDTVRYVYNKNGLLTEWYDGNNNRMIANEYDAYGRVIKQTDARGGISTLAYTESTTTLTDAEGNITTYSLDGSLRVVGVAGDRVAETRTYNSENRLVSTTDALGNATTYTYDAAGNVTRKQRADGTYEAIAYDAQNNPTQVRDFAGNITTNRYNTDGYLIETTLPDGSTITYTRDEHGRPKTITDGDSNTTTFVWNGTASMAATDGENNTSTYYYDPQGNLINTVNALGIEHKVLYTKAGKQAGTWVTGNIQTSNLFDKAGNCIALIDADGYRTSFAYDAQNNLVSVTDATGATMTSTYDLLGNKTSVRDPAGDITTYTYDGAGRCLTKTDAAGTVTTNTYDTLGRMRTATDALGSTSTYTYDDILGLPLLIDSPKGQERFAYDVLGNVTAHTATDGRQEGYLYDAMGRVQETTAPTGLASTYTYDTNGNITQIRDSEGRTQVFTYDKAGHLTTFKDAEGNEFAYTYDATGNLTAETLPDGAQYAYTYDALGNTTSVTYPDGVVEGFDYDRRGNLIARTDRAGETTTYAYDARSDLSSATDALGGVVSYTYTSTQLPEVVIGALSQTTIYSYDALSRPVAIIDPLGHLSQIIYDAAGNATRTTAADGSTTLSTYDAAGRLTKVVDAVGYEVNYAYDSDGRMSGWTDNAGASMDFSYDAAGRLIREVDVLGREATYAYDSYDNLISTTDFNGDTTTATYDRLNQKVSETTPDNRVTMYSYDSAGRLTSTKDAEGNVTSFAYNLLGNLVSTTDALGALTTYAYDLLGNLVETTYADGSAESGDYDALGRLVTAIDANGNATGYTYDASSRLTGAHYPDATSIEVAYDAAGNVAAQKDEEGFVTTYTYDEVSRLTNETSPRGAKTYYVYDAQGNLAEQIDSLGNKTRYSYLINGSLEAKTLPNGLATTYAYDAAGRLTSVSDSLGLALDLTYDAAGNIATETDQKGATYTYTYDEMHRVISATDPLGATTKNTYDGRGNLISSVVPGGGTYTYTYDALGRMIEGQKPQTAPVGFAYDERGRLVATTQADKTSTYDFDGVGNLTQATDALAHITAYTYDERNRLASVTNAKGATTSLAYSPTGRIQAQTDELGNTKAYAYDADGNLVKETDEHGYETAYSYDLAANLTKVEDAKGRTVTFDYDAMGNIVEKTAGTTKTEYGYDLHNNLTSITSPDGSIESFVYDTDSRLVSKINPDGSTISYDYDALDSLIAKRYSTDETNVVYGYDSRGLRLSMDDATGTSTYTYDEAGRIASYTNGDNKTLAYTYDEYGRTSTVTYPEGRVVTYTWDLTDNLIEVADSVRGVVTYTYDEVGNVMSCTRPEGLDTTYTYDAANRLLTLVNTQGGQVLSSFVYTYDKAGNIATEDASEPGVNYLRTFGYDEMGELVSVDEAGSNGNEVTTYTYDEQGNRTATVKGADNYTDTYTYDTQGRLTESRDGKTGDTTRFGYDANGNLVSRQGADKDLTYSYDIENRLKAVHDGGELLMATSYDGDGNRTFNASKILVRVDYSYLGLPIIGESKGEAEDDSTDSPAGDAKGGSSANAGGVVPGPQVSQTPAESTDGQKRESLFWYGFANGIIGLSSVLNPLASPHALAWLHKVWDRDDDQSGEQAQDERNEHALESTGINDKDIATVLAPPKAVAPGDADSGAQDADGDADVVIPLYHDSFLAIDYELTYYLNDVSMENVQVAATFGEKGELKDSYVYGTERIFDDDATTGKATTYLYDGRGSVAQTTSDQGVGATFAYDAWGRPTAGVGAFEVAYAYNGEEYSQVTGLTYLRARYYAPDTASFITCDSVLGEPVDINSQNRYSYAQSDPVNNFDPTGHAITNNAYERAMERGGGINEIYNFYVGSTLASSLGQTNVAFNARLGVAQRTDYRSLGAINAISQVSQAEANRHISAGAAAALAIGKLYGCTPGALTTGAIDAFALNVNAAKETTNQRIAQVKSNKYAQYQQYQRYLAYLAWVAEQERLLAEAYRQYNIMLGNLASAYMQNMAQAIQQQQRAAALSKVISSIKGAAYSAVGSMFGNNRNSSIMANLSNTGEYWDKTDFLFIHLETFYITIDVVNNSDYLHSLSPSQRSQLGKEVFDYAQTAAPGYFNGRTPEGIAAEIYEHLWMYENLSNIPYIGGVVQTTTEKADIGGKPRDWDSNFPEVYATGKTVGEALRKYYSEHPTIM